MNHGWSFGKEMAGGRLFSSLQQAASRQSVAIVKVTAPNGLCNLPLLKSYIKDLSAMQEHTNAQFQLQGFAF